MFLPSLKIRSIQWIMLLLVVALLLPWIPGIGSYGIHIIVLAMLYMVLALGLNVVLGFTGLLDLGYVGFYGIGAYTAGLLSLNYHLSFWIILPIAALNGALWGVLRGAPTLRLTGDYFAIVTFGFSELVVLIITNETWLTRGPMGLPGIAPPSIFSYEFRGEKPYYYLIFVLLILTVIIMRRLENSRLGRAWFAIREDDIAAESCGINLMRYKVIAFAVSAAFGSIGGAFFAHWMTFVSPNSFKFWESIMIVCMIVLGGMGSIPGTMLGALILVSLGEVFRILLPQIGLPESSRYLIFGILVIIMMRFRPEGLIPVTWVKGEMHSGEIK